MLKTLINKIMNAEETTTTNEIPVVETIETTPETPVEVTAEVAETLAKEFAATCYNQSGEFVQGFQSLDEAYTFAGENGYQVSIK